ncbi:MAG: hypothetical protein Q9167_001476 [Letrouitia subvulpina]
MDPEEKCMSSSINSLDIERNAYYDLTGQSPGSGPNLQVSISPTDCAGGSWQSPGQSTSGQSSPDVWNSSAQAGQTW